MKNTINKLPKSEIEIEGELDSELFESYYQKALKKIGEKVEIDGFRKGKVPENILTASIPEMKILEEMAEMALAEHYPKIIEEEKIDPIARPEIAITKLARNNPLGFKIKTTVMPEVILPEYKTIASKIIKEFSSANKTIEVADEELENTIMDIRKSRAPKINVKDAPANTEGVEADSSETKELALPPFDEEFVKGLGPFESIEDFKEKLKENLKLEKENQSKEKNRIQIMEEIIKESKIEVPEILIELELNKILYKMESDIVAMGMKFEDYLKHLNKTVSDLQKEFRPDAEKKAKLGLILNKISTTENIVADEEEVAKEVAHILEHYKDADPERAEIHARGILTNERIFQFLETQ